MKSKHSPNKYDDAFKREAVRLVTEDGRPAASVREPVFAPDNGRWNSGRF